MFHLDLIQSAWTQNNQTGQKMRTLSYTMSLTQAIGPRSCQVTETQVKMKFCFNNNLHYRVHYYYYSFQM